MSTNVSKMHVTDMFPLANGANAEDVTSKFLYAVVEILLDFINQSNDRDSVVLDFHHPSQITKAMDFSLPDFPLPLEQLVADCRAALRCCLINLDNHYVDAQSAGIRSRQGILTSSTNYLRGLILCQWQENGLQPQPTRTCSLMR